MNNRISRRSFLVIAGSTFAGVAVGRTAIAHHRRGHGLPPGLLKKRRDPVPEPASIPTPESEATPELESSPTPEPEPTPEQELTPTPGAEPTPEPEPTPDLEPDLRRIPAFARTEPVQNPSDFDEPVLWLNPNDPADSLIIVTDKANSDDDHAGLKSFNLDGSLHQSVREGFRPNNIDIRYNFPLGDTTVPLLATSDRFDNRALFFTVDQDPDSPTYRDLIDITGSNTNVSFEPYGQALYHDGDSDRYYCFLSQRHTTPRSVHQFEITEGTGNDAGSIVFADTTPERRIDYRPSADGSRTEQLGLCEGMRADDIYHVLYVGEETVGVHRYGARPEDGTVGETIDTLMSYGSNPGNIIPDEVEGIDIVDLGNGQGKILAVGQNPGGQSRIEVYDRVTNEHLHSVEIIENEEEDIPRTRATDGVFAHFGALNETYQHGMLISMSDNQSGNGLWLTIARYEDVWPEDIRAATLSGSELVEAVS